MKAWHEAIFPKGRYIEVCYNLMCLSRNAHRYRGKGYYALKPISLSPDKKCLTVKFFWLRKGPCASFVNLCDTPSLEGRDQGPCYARLWNHETTDLIQSGTELRFETEDPENLPLPKYELLEMQWFLNRVVAMSGAADIEDDYDNDDDGGWLEQREDFDMLDEWDSQDEQQSLATEPRSSSSPPPSLAPPSPPGFPKRRMLLNTVATQISAVADSVDTEPLDGRSQVH